MHLLSGIAGKSFELTNQMAPYILLGLLVAGLLHVLFPTQRVVRHLGSTNVASVVKAALIGIPLPLCSCGVLPTALSLRKQGSSRGAVLSFLITTPTSGVDSLLVTYSLLGALFAVYRTIASFVSGFFAGVLANVMAPEQGATEALANSCCLCEREGDHTHSVGEKTKGIVTYAFRELLGDMGGWLLIGIVIGGIISFFIPDQFIQQYLGLGWLSMFIMLIVGIPLYVCATASVPIAAALMLKGMSPGAALVFLLAGPATNTVTVTLVARYLGRRSTIIYLGSVAVTGLLLGWLLNLIWKALSSGEVRLLLGGAGWELPPAVSYGCTILLLIAVMISLLHRYGVNPLPKKNET